LQASNTPKFIENPLSPVEFAFNDGVEDYYQHVDPFGAPCMRALAAITAYEELRKRTTRELDLLEVDEVLKQVEKAKESISGGKGLINLNKTIEALQQIEYVAQSKKARLDFIFEPETAYKFAAVVFFDKNESPLRYDSVYGQRKIDRWKKDMTVSDFFFRQPINRLIPFSGESELNLDQYSSVVTKIMSLQYQRLSTIKSNEHSTTEPVAI
jgi:hypothetical protein